MSFPRRGRQFRVLQLPGLRTTGSNGFITALESSS